MERFVNGKEFQRLIQRSKSGADTSAIQRRCSYSKKLNRCTRIVLLPSENVIPMTWVEEALGKGAYIRKKKKVLPSPPN